MNCPKRPETILHGRMARAFPEILSQDNEDIEIGDIEADTTLLIEPELDFDPDAPADLVIKNARLGLHEHEDACDVAVAGTVITRVGSAEDIASVTTDETTIIDAEGHSVVPGFTDSHLHLTVAMQRLGAGDVEEVRTAGEFKRVVAAYAEKHAQEPALYMFGLHYLDDPIISTHDCRRELDAVVADKPLVIFAHDLHTVWVNTKALETAGLLHQMPPYPHMIEELKLQDKIVLDAQNQPTGEFREPEVYYFVTGPLQAAFAPTVEKQLERLSAVCQELARLGITSVHRMALAQPAEDIAFLLLLIELEQRGKLPIRVNTSCSSIADSSMLQDLIRTYDARNLLMQARRREINAVELHEGLLELLKAAGEGRHGKIDALSRTGGAGEHHPSMGTIVAASSHIKDHTHRTHVKPHADRKNPHRHGDMPEHLPRHSKIRCDTVKIFLDGVVEKNTAYRLDRPPAEGIPEFGQEELDRLLECADKIGLQVAAHAIGDGSVKSMLDAIARAHRKNDAIDEQRTHRIPHRVEHIETCRDEDLHRFGRESVVTSMQPLHERPPMTLWHQLVPKEEWNTAFAWKEALTNGGILVFGSDWPIVPCDVRQGINHAVTRKPWYEGARPQGVDLEEALAAYTANAARTEYCGNVRGGIRPGMLADMVVLSTHVAELTKERPQVDIRATVCNGDLVYVQES